MVEFSALSPKNLQKAKKHLGRLLFSEWVNKRVMVLAIVDEKQAPRPKAVRADHE